MILALAAVVAVAALTLFWWTHRSTDRIVASQVRRVCVVALKDGSTFKGVLDRADQRSLILRDASFLQDTEFVPVDGTALIFRADVGHIQLL